MSTLIRKTAAIAAIGAGLAGAAAAQTDVPAGVHTVSEHWTTAGSPYRLKGQVYFSGGATLTIDAGVIVASLPADGGSLAICRGSQIFVNGTLQNPVIMTSTNDVATWTGTTGSGATQIPGNPKSGSWRDAQSEWGNLTVMGDAFISENAVGLGNVSSPNASNKGNMEGLTNGPSTDQYGGGNDDDDSGTIRYLSLRYGGKVVGLNNELNGLSLGGLGRGTDIDHVDIMNNVDDGIEIWGGTVNLKYVNIWNVGDDSFDLDQGWRGKAQFGLIVLGYSAPGTSGATGSGVGDHAFEMDGAEDSDWQPVTTTSLYNFTVIGQPGQLRGATAWRDNARVQFHNCSFMDFGGEVVKNDNLDGDGAHGYGFNGTLDWPTTWTTAYNAVPPTGNDPASPATFYPVQTSGKLAEITDTVFFRNTNANAYTEATARGVFAAGQNNVITAGINPADAPVQGITRGSPVSKPTSSVTELPVTFLDPRPANAALLSIGAAPSDGFYTPAQYRGGFAPGAQSWLCSWTASFAFGYTPACDPGTPFCFPGLNSVLPCVCGNTSGAGVGCANTGSAGASISAAGVASLAADATDPGSLTLAGSSMLSGGSCIFLQGNGLATGGSTPFGAGIRCVGGQLFRLYVKPISGGAATGPQAADRSISNRSSDLGGPIAPGEVRYYQIYYRDPGQSNPGGSCPANDTFNITTGTIVVWS